MLFSLARYESYVIVVLLLIVSANVGIRAYVFNRLPDVTVWSPASASAAGLSDQSTEDSSPEGTASSSEKGAESPKKINLNRATYEELLTLPGIGPALASRILAYRQEKGPFKDVRELLEVSGIGHKRLEILLPLVEVGKVSE